MQSKIKSLVLTIIIVISIVSVLSSFINPTNAEFQQSSNDNQNFNFSESYDDFSVNTSIPLMKRWSVTQTMAEGVTGKWFTYSSSKQAWYTHFLRTSGGAATTYDDIDNAETYNTEFWATTQPAVLTTNSSANNVAQNTNDLSGFEIESIDFSTIDTQIDFYMILKLDYDPATTNYIELTVANSTNQWGIEVHVDNSIGIYYEVNQLFDTTYTLKDNFDTSIVLYPAVHFTIDSSTITCKYAFFNKTYIESNEFNFTNDELNAYDSSHAWTTLFSITNTAGDSIAVKLRVPGESSKYCGYFDYWMHVVEAADVSYAKLTRAIKPNEASSYYVSFNFEIVDHNLSSPSFAVRDYFRMCVQQSTLANSAGILVENTSIYAYILESGTEYSWYLATIPDETTITATISFEDGSIMYSVEYDNYHYRHRYSVDVADYDNVTIYQNYNFFNSSIHAYLYRVEAPFSPVAPNIYDYSTYGSSTNDWAEDYFTHEGAWDSGEEYNLYYEFFVKDFSFLSFSAKQLSYYTGVFAGYYIFFSGIDYDGTVKAENVAANHLNDYDYRLIFLTSWASDTGFMKYYIEDSSQSIDYQVGRAVSSHCSAYIWANNETTIKGGIGFQDLESSTGEYDFQRRYIYTAQNSYVQENGWTRIVLAWDVKDFSSSSSADTFYRATLDDLLISNQPQPTDPSLQVTDSPVIRSPPVNPITSFLRGIGGFFGGIVGGGLAFVRAILSIPTAIINLLLGLVVYLFNQVADWLTTTLVPLFLDIVDWLLDTVPHGQDVISFFGSLFDSVIDFILWAVTVIPYLPQLFDLVSEVLDFVLPYFTWWLDHFFNDPDKFWFDFLTLNFIIASIPAVVKATMDADGDKTLVEYMAETQDFYVRYFRTLFVDIPIATLKLMIQSMSLILQLIPFL